MTSDKRLSLAEFRDEKAWPQLPQLGVQKNSKPLFFFGFEDQKSGTLLQNKVHLKSELRYF